MFGVIIASISFIAYVIWGMYYKELLSFRWGGKEMPKSHFYVFCFLSFVTLLIPILAFIYIAFEKELRKSSGEFPFFLSLIIVAIFVYYQYVKYKKAKNRSNSAF